eukprot:gb/GECG01005661.1/.p1 GENE.gb/GECG01005661.1/~~gb/GECG01005661.1/.p1  ORF type:complete len:1533 (+),score=231.60 gb/GECG01005661.1/:1-4599(+)
MDTDGTGASQANEESSTAQINGSHHVSVRSFSASSSTREKEDSIEGVWVETADDKGRTYYYNTVTLAAQWEKPAGENVISENDIEWLEDDTPENSVHEDDEAEEAMVDKVVQSLQLSRSQTVRESENDDPVTLEAALCEIHYLRQEKRELKEEIEQWKKAYEREEREKAKLTSYIEDLQTRYNTLEYQSSYSSNASLAKQDSQASASTLSPSGSSEHIDNSEIKNVMSLMKSISLFHTFSEQQFSRLCIAVRKQKWRPGEIIIRQGESGDMFFIIASGRVAVRKKSKEHLESHESSSSLDYDFNSLSFSGREFGDLDDESDNEEDDSFGATVAELTKGFFFGERALLLDEPRAATCMALTEVECYTLNRHAFKSVLSDVEEILGSYAKKHYTESPEFLTLSSHITSFGHRMHEARKREIPLHKPIEDVSEMDPLRGTIDSMSVFSPEHSLNETLERICDTLGQLLNVRCARVFLYDKDKKTFMIPAPSLLDMRVSERSKNSVNVEASSNATYTNDTSDSMTALCYKFRKGIFQHPYISVGESGITRASFAEDKAGVLSAAIQERDVFTVENVVEDSRFTPGSDWAECQKQIDEVYKEFHQVAKESSCASLFSYSKTRDPSHALTRMNFMVPLKGDEHGWRHCQMMLVPILWQGHPVGVMQIIGKSGRTLYKSTRSFSAIVGQRVNPADESTQEESFETVFSEADVKTAKGLADVTGEAFQKFRHEMELFSLSKTFVPLFTLTSRFSVRVGIGERLTMPKYILQKVKNSKKKRIADLSAKVVARVFHGEYELCDSVTTAPCHFSSPNGDELADQLPVGHSTKNLRKEKSGSMESDTAVETNYFVPWHSTITFDIRICDLPPACRVVFEIQLSDSTTIGWTGCNLFSYQRKLNTGKTTIKLWPGEVTNAQIATTASPSNEYSDDERVGMLHIELPSFERDVWKNSGALAAVQAARSTDLNGLSINKSDLRMINERKQLLDDVANAQEFSGNKDRLLRLFDREPLYSMTVDEKSLVWRCRYFLLRYSSALPKFLLSVPWDNCVAVEEAYMLMLQWTILQPSDALQLLDIKFPDPKVRALAVNSLEQLNSDQLHQYMLQLTQVLKFEPYLDSALVRFLLRRALREPRLIGHVLFWYLKAEMHIPEIAARFGVVLDQYLRNSGEHRTDLGHQMFVMTKLERIASEVKAVTTKEERMQTVRSRVKEIVFPEKFQLPISPHLVVDAILPEKCRVMSSKKLPLWLTFVSASEYSSGTQDLIKVLFKAGDDLRQDQLTLQILGIMDRLWKEHDLDLCMSAYRCISTGDELGMVEIVEDAETLANIVKEEMFNDKQKKKAGFKEKVRAAMHAMWKSSVFKDWLLKQECNKDDHEGMKNRFVRSCAAYCVATYVLGIGDRHNDNIMLTRNGQLFHIDFGHFLGNFKSKLGYKREKAPFVFTPAFAEVMGGINSADFARFEDLCCEAYNILRKNANLLITLFFLMLSCGLPELKEESDIYWLRDKLMLNVTDAEASSAFRERIRESMNTKATLLNHAVHSFAHG